MIHFNTNRLPFLKSEDKTKPRENQFVAIDDFSHILYTAILPYKSQHSDTTFLQQVLDELTQNGVQAQSYTVLL